MCSQDLQTQCETTQVREQGMGAALFGYTKLYGQIPGGQAAIQYAGIPAGGTVVVLGLGPIGDMSCRVALHHAFRVIGVYGGMADPLPMLTIFDKQIQLRMGQANVHRWSDDILPLLADDDPLNVDSFATHHLPLSEGPDAYEMFQKKHDGAVKILLTP